MPPGGEESVFVPEKQSAERWIALLLFVFSCSYLLLFRRYTVMNPDEGIVLQGAQRILQGEVLYRDFFSFYTPGSYYGMALLFKVFGGSILVGRTVLLAYGGVFAVVTYLVARRVCSRWSAFTTASLVTILCLPFRFLVLHNWDSTFWACIALYCAVRFLERPHWGWAVGIGSTAAVTCLFEQSKGAGLFLGLSLGFVCLVLFGQRRDFFDRTRVAAMAAAFASPFFLTCAYFAAHHSLRQMIGSWIWPLQHYSAANILPYGYLILSTANRSSLFEGSWAWRLFVLLLAGPFLLLPALPILGFGTLVLKSMQIQRVSGPSGRSAYFVVVSATLSGLLLGLLATKRPDFTHILYLAPLFCVVLAWVLDSRNARLRAWGYVKPVLILYVIVSFTGVGISSLWGPLQARYTLQTRRGTLRSPVPDAAITFIQANAAQGESIFVYPYEPLYYYLTATHSPTRYEYLQPGLHTADQFQESMQDLAADRTRIVLFEPSFNEKIPLAFPSTPVSVLGQRDSLADYILSNYRPCWTTNSTAIRHFIGMVRKDLICPKAEAGGSALK